ncbi:MAG: hypothetical protein JWN99_4 [Ilumatobacteraceae bacterium]|nr:hypothetical protein [Ilumatobacteraceae bacterium]
MREHVLRLEFELIPVEPTVLALVRHMLGDGCLVSADHSPASGHDHPSIAAEMSAGSVLVWERA